MVYVAAAESDLRVEYDQGDLAFGEIKQREVLRYRISKSRRAERALDDGDVVLRVFYFFLGANEYVKIYILIFIYEIFQIRMVIRGRYEYSLSGGGFMDCYF